MFSRNFQSIKTDVKVGDVCVVPGSGDLSWFRARVTDVREDDVSVLYVDYGNSAVVSRCCNILRQQKFSSKIRLSVLRSSSHFIDRKFGKWPSLLSRGPFT